jgi:hypothetical protein
VCVCLCVFVRVCMYIYIDVSRGGARTIAARSQSLKLLGPGAQQVLKGMWKMRACRRCGLGVFPLLPRVKCTQTGAYFHTSCLSRPEWLACFEHVWHAVQSAEVCLHPSAPLHKRPCPLRSARAPNLVRSGCYPWFVNSEPP